LIVLNLLKIQSHLLTLTNLQYLLKDLEEWHWKEF
jgi:hypothetical protein